MPKALVRKRCFVQMTGYEPVGPEHQHRRFIREMARFQKAWSVQGEVSPLTLSADETVANWTVETSGPNWHVTTEFHWFRWDDFVAADMAASDWTEISARHGRGDGVRADGDGGAIFYRGVAIRRIFPLSACLSFSGWLGFRFRRHDLPLSTLACRITWCSRRCFGWRSSSALRWTFGRLVHIGYALDDWYFARDFIHRVRPGLEDRLDRLSHELVRLVRETDADEIIVDGHSLGAPLSLVVVDRALQIDPQLGARGKPLHIVSSGSSLLKVALHPAAGWLREAVGRIANAPAVYWVEYQSLVDVINVYKVDPVAALGLPATGKPIVKIIRIRMMVEEHTYRRFRLNFLRIHRQAVMGNERRYFYDYYMLCCGPIALTDRVEMPEQAVAAFAQDGALVDGVSGGGGLAVALPASASEI